MSQKLTSLVAQCRDAVLAFETEVSKGTTTPVEAPGRLRFEIRPEIEGVLAKVDGTFEKLMWYGLDRRNSVPNLWMAEMIQRAVAVVDWINSNLSALSKYVCEGMPTRFIRQNQGLTLLKDLLVLLHQWMLLANHGGETLPEWQDILRRAEDAAWTLQPELRCTTDTIHEPGTTNVVKEYVMKSRLKEMINEVREAFDSLAIYGLHPSMPIRSLRQALVIEKAVEIRHWIKGHELHLGSYVYQPSNPVRRVECNQNSDSIKPLANAIIQWLLLVNGLRKEKK